MCGYMMKECSKCQNTFNLDEFHKSRKGKYGRVSVCKACRKLESQSRKKQKAKYDKTYRHNNKERIQKYQKYWKQKNKDKVLEYQRKYRDKYKDKVNAKAAKYMSKRLEGNITVKLAHNIRKRLYKAVKYNRRYSSITMLGCSIEHLKKYLEDKFYKHPDTGEMMTWKNYGKWHIDHIKPLISFNLTDENQLRQACHYTNLQPLWAKENISKGGNYDN